MALKKCKECGNKISTKAVSCPQCGAVIKKKTGCLGNIGALLVIIIVFVMIGAIVNETNDTPTDTKPDSARNQPDKTETTTQSKTKSPRASTKTENNEGDTVNVGYTTYAVWKSWWSNRLSSNEYLDQSPNATYLFVELTVRNDDKKARMVPPLTLIDENGAEYEASSNGWAVDGAIGILESLNPSVSKQGFVVFDVPKNRTYKLKLSGGYWSGKDAYVLLSPKDNRY